MGTSGEPPVGREGRSIEAYLVHSVLFPLSGTYDELVPWLDTWVTNSRLLLSWANNIWVRKQRLIIIARTPVTTSSLSKWKVGVKNEEVRLFGGWLLRSLLYHYFLSQQTKPTSLGEAKHGLLSFFKGLGGITQRRFTG